MFRLCRVRLKDPPRPEENHDDHRRHDDSMSSSDETHPTRPSDGLSQRPRRHRSRHTFPDPDPDSHPPGIKVTDDHMESLAIRWNLFCGEWNHNPVAPAITDNLLRRQPSVKVPVKGQEFHIESVELPLDLVYLSFRVAATFQWQRNRQGPFAISMRDREIQGGPVIQILPAFAPLYNDLGND